MGQESNGHRHFAELSANRDADRRLAVEEFARMAAGESYAEYLDMALGALCRALAAKEGRVWLIPFDGKAPQVRAACSHGSPSGHLGPRGEEVVAAVVARTGRPASTSDPRFERTFPAFRRAGVAGPALDVVPLSHLGRRVGALALGFSRPRVLSPDERALVDLFSALAASGAIAVHCAAIEARDRLLGAAASRPMPLPHGRSPAEIATAALVDLCRLYESPCGAIWRWDEGTGAFALEAWHAREAAQARPAHDALKAFVAQGVVAEVFGHHRRIELHVEAATTEFRALNPYLRRLHCRAALAIPLDLHGEHPGVLMLALRDGRSLRGREREVLELLASQVAAALTAALLGEAAAHEVASRLAVERRLRRSLESLRQKSVALRSQRDEIARAREIERQQLARLKELDLIKLNFLNAASHELRTPLSSIKGYAEFLEDDLGGSLTEAQRSYVTEIQDGAERLRRIVDDMLDFGRLEAGTFSISCQESDVRPLLESAVRSLLPQAKEAEVTLSCKLPAAPVACTIDPKRVEQVLLNLLGNAIKFTRPGGTVTVRVAAKRDQVRVEVRDTGIGIAPDHLARIFEKFFQADPSMTRERGGAGLGLAISKAIVEKHGGKIGVRSTVEQGSTFWFTLPVTAGAPRDS